MAVVPTPPLTPEQVHSHRKYITHVSLTARSRSPTQYNGNVHQRIFESNLAYSHRLLATELLRPAQKAEKAALEKKHKEQVRELRETITPFAPQENANLLARYADAATWELRQLTDKLTEERQWREVLEAFVLLLILILARQWIWESLQEPLTQTGTKIADTDIGQEVISGAAAWSSNASTLGSRASDAVISTVSAVGSKARDVVVPTPTATVIEFHDRVREITVT